jgi:hypothetical protein
MVYFHPDWLAHQRERWLPPRARRWLKPEMLRALGLPDPGAMRTAAAAPASPHDINEHERQETEWLRVQREIASLRLELALLRLGETWRRKANFNPNQPRVPAGNSDGGQWTDGGGQTGERIRLGEPQPRTRLAGPLPSGEKPEIPKTRPSSREARRSALARARKWTGALELLYQGAQWLRGYHAELLSYRDPPKTMEELQKDVRKPSVPGYHDHHINEEDAALKDGFPNGVVNGPENLVRIPKRKHEEITGWYMSKNDKFKDERGVAISPRDYLYGKDWSERRRIGLEALIQFGVLKP